MNQDHTTEEPFSTDEAKDINSENATRLYETDKKPENEKKRRQILGIGAGVLALVLSASIWAANSQKKDFESASVTISETAHKTTEPTETTLTEVETNYAEAMQKYEDMSVEDYNKMTVLERLPYAQYLIDITGQSSDYDQTYGMYQVGDRYSVEYTPASLDNSGQEILDNWIYNRQISFLQHEDGRSFDHDDAAKVFSAVFTDVDLSIPNLPTAYTGLLDYQETMEDTTGVANIMIEQETYPIEEYIDSEGTTVPCITIKFNDDAQDNKDSLYARFFYYEFISYDGTQKGIWLCDDVKSDPALFS